MSERSEYIGFLDESGDHSLEKIDEDYPIFVLCLVVIERAAYESKVLPAINKFKLTYWDHEGVSLHSSDIRKQKGEMAFLRTDSALRERFLSEIDDLMQCLPYTVFVSAIRKKMLVAQYVHPASPYELSLTFILERLLDFGRSNDVDCLPIVAESRGTNEDKDLERYFYRLISTGTSYHSRQEFIDLSPQLGFRKKRDNVVGLQIADLAAHPCGRHYLNRRQPNRAFRIVEKHFYRGDWSRKLFP